MCETESAKRSGYALRRRLIKVDLPEPEGPETTIGRGLVSEMGVRELVDLRRYGWYGYLLEPWWRIDGARGEVKS